MKKLISKKEEIILKIQRTLTAKDQEAILGFMDVYRLIDIDKVQLRRNLESLIYYAKFRYKTNFRKELKRILKYWK